MQTKPEVTKPSLTGLNGKCPKCSAVIRKQVECVKCGLLFEKFQLVQLRREEEAKRTAASRYRRKLLTKIVSFVLLFLVVHSLMIFTTIKYAEPLKRNVDFAMLAPDNLLKLRVDEQEPADEPENYLFIESALQATVSIDTPWGIGSGFFITPNVIVTNKHVVEFSDEEFVKIKAKVQRNRKYLDLEKDKIYRMKRMLKKMTKGPEKEQMRLDIQEKEEVYQQASKEQQAREDHLASLKSRLASPVIKVIMYDGEEQVVTHLEYSFTKDLALIYLHGKHNAGYLAPRARGNDLKQGAAVYTVGSPRGLRNTVTSGIFSGYRWKGEENRYLQIDAPINPGNSGGPLIDKNGNAIGVNTLSLLDSDGLGFAIPIETVYEEFEYLQRPK